MKIKTHFLTVHYLTNGFLSLTVENQEEARNSGMIEVVFDAIKKHITNQYICNEGCAALASVPINGKKINFKLIEISPLPFPFNLSSHSNYSK